MADRLRLWCWGHAVGIAYTSDVTQSDLVMNLLPAGDGYVGRHSVKFQRCDFSAATVKAAQWTTLARNYGGWELPVRYYPGSMSRIWTPHDTGKGLIEMQISDQSNAAPELTHEEFLDAHFYQLKGKQKREHQRTLDNLGAHKELNEMVAAAKLRTAAADAKWTGQRPTFTEARGQDLSASEVKPNKAKTKAVVAKQQAELTEHEKMMERLMREVDNREQENA